MKEDIQRHVRDLSQIALAAKLSYEIWWILVGPDRPKYVDTLNKYLSFFEPTIDAHRNTLIVSLYKLYDRDRKTKNLNRLLRTVKSDNTLPKDDLVDLDSKHEQARAIWQKVRIIRNKYVAHQSFNVDIAEVYQRANIKPDEFSFLIDLTTEILNKIYSHYNRTTIAYSMLSAKKDTYRLLDKLTLAEG